MDIEKERDILRLAQVADRFFAPTEYAQWRGVAQAERRRAFFRLWTLKEAYLKAWGTGLTFPSQRFEIRAPVPGSPSLAHTQMEGDEPSRWVFADLPAQTGYAAAVCYEAPPRTLRFWTPDP